MLIQNAVEGYINDPDDWEQQETTEKQERIDLRTFIKSRSQ